MVSTGAATTQDSDGNSGPLQFVIDQLEELVVTLIEEIRERPGIAAAIAAGVIGAMVGSWLAARGRARTRRRTARKIVMRGQAVDAARAAGTVVQLLQNPFVRGLIVAQIERQLKNRMAVAKH